jgi:WD40 repeat protein
MKSPFKFLDSYTKDDRNIFFGRDREIEELYQRVFDSKLLLVYGVSGTGKSSLINCGLANKFSETDWLPLVIRRGGNIIDSMSIGIKAASITGPQTKYLNPGDFKKGVRSLYLDYYKPVFLIFDQFEELFIFGDKEERRSFIHIIKTLTESDLQCRMIFIMREEYMAGLTEFERYIPTFFANRVRIEKISHKNALDTIKGPCNAFNISIEEGFAETLLEKLSPGETDIELTYLQVFIDKAFSQVQGDNSNENRKLSFTNELLQKIGNVSDILGSFLDEQISMLDDPDTGLALLKSFVSVKGTKQPMNPEEAREYVIALGSEVGESGIREMIQTFVNLRILCDKDQNERYELRHDALATKIFEKFTMAEKELLEVRKYVENAFSAFENRGVFLSKDDLDYLANYDNKLILPKKLSDFISESSVKLHVRKKALKHITSISTLIFLIIMAITLRFYISTQEKDNVNNLFRSALIMSATDPVKGLIAELDLWEKDSTSSQLHSFILKSFQKVLQLDAENNDPVLLIQKSLRPVKLEYSILNAEMSPSGGYIIGWTENQYIFIFNTSDGEINYFKADNEIKHIEISEVTSQLAIIYSNRQVSVCDFTGKKLYNFTTTLNEMINDKLVCFSPSGRDQLVAVKDSIVLIYNSSGTQVDELKAHSANINSVDISPDGRFIVTASDDRRAYIWNYVQKTGKYGIYDSLIGHRDRIWSCRFNKTGKYIITTSADSTIKIWDLNGTHINSEFNFILSNTRYRLNRVEEDEDVHNPYYSKYYGKFCDAYFSRSELEIIATGYNTPNDSPGNIKANYYKVLFYDGVGGFPYGYERSYFTGSPAAEQVKPMTFSELLISSDNKIAAAVDSISSRIYLVTGTSYILITLPGKNPMFSNKEKDLYWISGDKIFRSPIHPKEIKKLIEPLRNSLNSKEINFVEI